MGIVDVTLVLKKNAFQSMLLGVLIGIGSLIYYIGFVQVPQLLWNQERNIRMMMTQEQIDRMEMEKGHMQAYADEGHPNSYQRRQLLNLPGEIAMKKNVYSTLESAKYPDVLVSGPRGQ